MLFNNGSLDLTTPKVMGILNVTPDSFSDGGKFDTLESAIAQTANMIEQGADIIDIGGESTRPGAQAVMLQEELDRTVPVIEALSSRFDTLLSIDTSKALVMTEAVNAGAALINDVRALREEGALAAAANSGAAVCLMHMQGQPRSMQISPTYTDVVSDISQFLATRIDDCIRAGIPKTKIMIDPGFGFGKTLPHNYQLLDRLNELHCLSVPILIGLSRKSMIGKVLDCDVQDRLAGSLAAATIGLMKGAHILRVHDVKQTVDTIKIVSALSTYKE